MSAINNRVRGIRQQLPGSVVLGRSTGGKGPAQAIPLSSLLAQVAAAGVLPPAGQTKFANPTAQVSGSTVNGTATTAMRSDAAPALANTAVTPGSYTYSSLTVDQQGRLTAASSGAAPASAANPTAQVSGSAVNGTATTFMRSDAAPKLADTAVTPGSYTAADITVDQQGRITAASDGSSGVTFTDEGAWSGFSGYSVGNVVQYNGAAYLCYKAIAAPTGTDATWDASHTGTNLTLSSTNHTATNTGGGTFSATLGTAGAAASAGKRYFEATPSNLLGNNTSIGVGLTTTNVNTDTANQAFSTQAIGTVYDGNGFTGNTVGLSNSKTVGVAVDFTAHLFWITKDVTAPNWNGTSANPSAGTGGLTFWSGFDGLSMVPFFASKGGTGEVCTINCGDSSFVGTVPTGFSNFASGATANTSPDQDDSHWVSQGINSTVLDDTFGSTQGDILYRNATTWTATATLTTSLTLGGLTISNTGATGFAIKNTSAPYSDTFLAGSAGNPNLIGNWNLTNSQDNASYASTGIQIRPDLSLIYVTYAAPGTIGAVLATNITFHADTGDIVSGRYVYTGGYTVATLPTPLGAGARAYVTDATAPTFLGALTGGGTVVCPVFFNGTAWVAG